MMRSNFRRRSSYIILDLTPYLRLHIKIYYPFLLVYRYDQRRSIFASLPLLFALQQFPLYVFDKTTSQDRRQTTDRRPWIMDATMGDSPWAMPITLPSIDVHQSTRSATCDLRRISPNGSAERFGILFHRQRFRRKSCRDKFAWFWSLSSELHKLCVGISLVSIPNTREES
jgi:hypothetical protein